MVTALGDNCELTSRPCVLFQASSCILSCPAARTVSGLLPPPPAALTEPCRVLAGSCCLTHIILHQKQLFGRKSCFFVRTARQLGTCSRCLSHRAVYIGDLGGRQCPPGSRGSLWGESCCWACGDVPHRGLSLTPGLGGLCSTGCTELVMRDWKEVLGPLPCAA